MARTKTQALNFQADCIEAVLAQYQVQARVTGGVLAPRWVQFQVLPALGARVNKIKGLAEELALALNTSTCRVARQGGVVTVEVPRLDPQPVRLLALQKRLKEKLPPGTAILGLGENGGPLLIRLPSPQVAHVFIAGTTGSGKSALARTIITSLALRHRPSELRLVLVDPKRRAFGPLAGLPHLLYPVLTEPEDSQRALEGLVGLMLWRDQNGQSSPRIVVVIDELADLMMATGKGVGESITRLAQRGREAGIHLIACTQKPAAAVVGSLAKANFPVRLVGQVTSPEDAKVATGYGGTGAEKLRGPGDFIAVTGGETFHFQAAYVSPQESADIVERILQSTGPAKKMALPRAVASQTDSVDTKLQEYADLAEPAWRKARLPSGELARGGRANMCEAIFDVRDMAGHRGKWVERVRVYLEEKFGAGLDSSEDRPDSVCAVETRDENDDLPSWKRILAPSQVTTTAHKSVNSEARGGSKPFAQVVVTFHLYEKGIRWRINDFQHLQSSPPALWSPSPGVLTPLLSWLSRVYASASS